MKRHILTILIIGTFALPSLGAVHAISRSAKAAKKPAVKAAHLAKRAGLETLKFIF